MPRHVDTPERTTMKARIAEMWDQQYSAGMIAQELGVTRNIIIGLVYRMKLPKHKSSRRVGYVRDGKPGPKPSSPRLKPKLEHVAPPAVVTIPFKTLSKYKVRPLVGFMNAPEPSKNELRRQIAEAMQNTAKLPPQDFMIDRD